MKPKMRRKLKIPGATLLLICLLALVALLGNLRVQQERAAVMKDKTIEVSHVLQESNVNLNNAVIDLSGWQRPDDIDYNVVSQHVIGAIIRVNGSYGKADGSASADGEDTAYKTHIAEFQKRGIPVAVYAFVTGKDNADMKQQAKDFYNRSKAYHPTYYWLDVEVTNMKDMNGGIEAFRSELASLGAKNIGIYAQDWFLKANNINVSKFNAIWIAAYGRNTGMWDTNPSTNLKYDIQQFTDKGTVPGYSGNVDLSLIRTQAEYDKLFKNKG